jgi:hypothetical protein
MVSSWYFILREEYGLRAFEINIIIRIFGAGERKQQECPGYYAIRSFIILTVHPDERRANTKHISGRWKVLPGI